LALSQFDPTTLTASTAAAAIARGEMSPETYIGACLARIAAVDGQVGAFVHLDEAYALEQARALDHHRSNGGNLGPLHGIPVAIKDLLDTADYPTEYGSPVLAGRRTGSDAAVVARLREAGAVIIGKTVTTEFAYFHPGKTRNPHDLTRTPGGSSSGSAAAVAAGMVPLAIGSQTNGSVIRPATFCGVFGLKPSHGLVSRNGALTLSRTLDHIGGFARSLDDLALLMDVIAGYDPADPDSRRYAAPAFRRTLTEPPPIEPSFTLMRTPMWDRADAEARNALEDLAREVGAREIELADDVVTAWDAHRAIMAAEMAFNLGHFVDRGGDISQQFRDLVDEGRAVTAAHYLAAVRDARRYTASLAEIFEQYSEAILTLPAKGVAPDAATTGDPLFCTFWTLTGLPAINLPLLQGESGLPIGVQLIGADGRDDRLLRTSAALIARLG
jgi:Asp-tRNA(Asn)/Glu-tRNA(Gln) amidotransferase A subunit family amidase